jgi:hypothetical protein
MKFKSVLITAVATIGLSATTIAQNVPSYVPLNNLAAWYPFNGNSSDESGNGNHLTNNGPTLTFDRFGNCNSAYKFTENQDLFKATPNTNGQNFTWSLWMKKNNTNIESHAIQETSSNSSTGGGFTCSFNTPQFICQGIQGNVTNSSASILNNVWYHYVITKNGSLFSIYVNGILSSSGNSSYSSYNTSTWFKLGGGVNLAEAEIDDVAMWNQVLNQSEISALYNATSPGNGGVITLQPVSQNTQIGNSIQFIVASNSTNPSYQWQANTANTGWINLTDNISYSGSNTNTLNINNISLENYNQKFRNILSTANCIDTSNVAVINILDTCITNVTVYDTLLTTVTDTLIINATITGINPPNNLNTMKVFPNPANTHITIDYGNFNAMSGYTLNIVNSVGQTVFTTPINQQTSYIDLSTWTGNGIYFVQLFDPQNNTIANRKIVIQ